MNILNFKLFDVDYTVNNSKNHWSGGLGIDKGIWEVETFKVFEYVKNKSKKNNRHWFLDRPNNYLVI
jgi:hypothetical protein